MAVSLNPDDEQLLNVLLTSTTQQVLKSNSQRRQVVTKQATHFQRRNTMNELLENPEIYNSPFSYFATISITLLSIIQGIALNGIIVEAGIGQFAQGLNWRVIEYVYACMFIIGLWHKYMQHHQFLGWQLTFVDTIILFLFGIGEAFMSTVLRDPSGVGRIHISVTSGFIVGTFAYWYAFYQMRAPYAQAIYKKHYGSAYEKVYPAMVAYERKSRNWTAFVAVILAIIATLCFFQPDLSKILSYLAVAVFAIYLWRMDLNGWLKNKEKWENLCKEGRDVLK